MGKDAVNRADIGSETAKPSVRDANGRFAKGNRTGGRKEIPPDVKKMLKAAVPDAVQLLIDTMLDEDAKTELRVKCAETIIDRVHGKATQPIEGDLAGGIVITLGDGLQEWAK